MLKETDGSTEDASSMTMPSDEWKQAFLQSFRNYRANLQQAVRKSRADKSTTVVRNDGKKGVSDRNDAGWMPGFNNRDNWWRFITGTMVVPTATDRKDLRNEKEGGVLVVESGIGKEHRKEEALEGGDIGDEEEADNDERDGEEESDDEERQMEVESSSDLPTIGDVVWESSDKGEAKGANITRSTAIIDTGRNDAGASASFGSGDTAHEPTLAILKRLSTRNIVQLLYWHSAWIDAYVDALEEEVEEQEQEQEQEENKKKRELALSRRPKEVHQQWMFTLLGVLEDSLVSHDISSLRTLARACLRLVCVARRLKMGEWVEWVLQEGNAEVGSTMSMRMGGFWMVIAAVVGIWGQHDLWDEARVQMRMAAATG